MSKKYLKKLKNSSLFSDKATKNLKIQLEKEAVQKEKELKKEFQDMSVEEIKKLFTKYIF